MDVTVQAPAAFPPGTNLSVYPDPVGDVVPSGPIAATAVVGSDSKVTFSGLQVGITYQAGGQVGGRWRGFLLPHNPPSGSGFIPEGDLAFDPVTDAELDAEVSQDDPPSALVRTAPPFISGRFRLRDRWAAGDFGVKMDGSDETAKLQTALLESRAAGRVLHLAEGTTRASAPLLGAETTGLAIRGAGKGKSIIEYTGATAACFNLLGSIANMTTLSAPAARGALTLTLATTAGLAAGDVIVVRDPTVPILGNAARTQAAARGQMRKIRSVDSGTQVTLWARLSWPFTTGSDVRRITPVRKVLLSDFSLVNPVPGTLGTLSRAMTLTYAEQIDIANIEFKDFDSACIYLQTSRDWRVADCDFHELRDLEQAFNPYSIIASHGSQFGLVDGCKQHYGRHLFTTGPSADGLEVPSQDILVANCEATALSQAAFDTHPGAVRIHFANCHVFGAGQNGFQIRGPDSTISNPIVEGAATGILAVDGADRLRVRGGVLADCDIGVQIEDTNDVRIRGLDIADPIVTGLLTVESASWLNTMTKLLLRDMEVTGDPSGYAFDFAGKWDDGYDLRELRAPDATRKIRGTPTTPLLDGLRGLGFDNGDIAPTGFEGPALSLTLAANTAHLSRYRPDVNRVISKLAFAVTTASGLDDAFDVGLYSLNVTAGVLTRIASSGSVTSASGAVSGGGLNTTGRKIVTLTAPVKVVAGTIYFVAIAAAAAGATVAASGMNSTIVNTLAGTTVQNIIAGSKAASFVLPATISGPSNAITGPKMAALVS